MADESSAGSSQTPIEPTRLDPPRPLSRSLLWRLEEAYYQRSGIGAWALGAVPSTMTNSPTLARAYVQLIESLVEDCLAGRMGRFDPSQPLYVLDLGCGTGRLGYYCAEALRRARTGQVRVVMVLTDSVEQNVAFLSSHPKLRPLIAEGRVDVATYDVGQAAPIRLLHAGAELVPGELANPLVAIANYLFDVLPQDLFRQGPVGLEEQLVEVFGDDEEPASEGWDLAEHLFLAAHHTPVPPDRYGERLQAVLDAASAEHHRQGERFLFPVVAIETIDKLRELASDRLLLLIAERDDATLLPSTEGGGDSDDEDAEGTPRAIAPAPQAYHPGLFIRLASYGGSFSLPVDLGILDIAAKQVGAEMLRGAGSAHRLAVAAIVTGDEGGASNIRGRFANSVVDLAPDDVFRTATAAISAVAASSERDERALSVLLAAIRMTGHDAIAFNSCVAVLAECLPPPEEFREETVDALERVNALNYWIKPQGDIAYAVATLLGRCGRYDRALELLEEAREVFGAKSTGYYNSAICLMGLNRVDEALAALESCLELEPTNDQARQLRDRLLAGVVAPPG
jgi:tetratricopeptide (TPR) repeat protein